MTYVKNEWMKLWAKKGTWVMLIISILLVVIPAIVIKVYNDSSENTQEERKAANEKAVAQLENSLADETTPDNVKIEISEEKTMAEYRLQNDLPSSDAMTIDLFMGISLDITSLFISLFAIIVAAGIVSQEFGTGTIKMLLTRPVARWKILLSKLLTPIIFGLLLYVVTVTLSAILGAILFGTDVGVDLSIVDGVVKEENALVNYFKSLALSFGSFFMSIFFAFMIGSIFESSSFAVGITLVIFFMGSAILNLLSKYEIIKYIWITNDLSQFAPGKFKIIEDLTLPFSLTVNAIYAIIFLAVSFIYFMKRDVTA